MADVTPVEAQVGAYNARDIEGFLACYAMNAVVEDSAGNTLMEGHEGMRARYAAIFAESPDLRAVIVQWIEIGDYVIDEERIHGRQAHPVRAVAVYHVSDGLIDHVRLFRG